MARALTNARAGRNGQIGRTGHDGNGGNPGNTRQRKLLLSAGLSWLFDAMDVGLISFVAAALAADWDLGKQQLGFLAAIGSVGMAVGAAVAGSMADRYGRRAILLATLLIFSVASGLSALATGFAMLCLLRFAAGFGLGGELPVASTLVSESVRAEDRGRAVVLLESFWAVGWIAAALIGYFVIPDYGWRTAFVIGALPCLYALYLRRAVQDPPRFKEQQRSRARVKLRDRFAQLWAPGHRSSTIALWVLWFTVVFSYYGMFLWLPQVMVLKGFSLVKSFEYVLFMTLAQLPGYFSAAWLIEKLGRKPVLTIYLTCTALCAWWFGASTSDAMLMTSGACLSFFNLGAWGAMYAYTPELYPTRIRSTGVGMAASFGRIGGVIGPYLVGYLLERGMGINGVFLIFCVAIAVGVVVLLALGTETKGVDPDAPVAESAGNAG
ncbi:MFS transporter [Cohnella sp. JJ-181]|uniref:MFS transporter n=1 Tax=Cohnella rhizoplanae TaxID=2974897 RepID=UPI0022FFA3DD|nr:MFS transporter [Cohnella sp. JJ-181]CAI6053458.1 Putative niacin/nicotinamide transporter NaiP [Cohnella sp. JJ-181]